MNKLENLQLNALMSAEFDNEDKIPNSFYSAFSIKSAQLTEGVSVKFANYIAENWTPNGIIGYWDSKELNSNNESKYLVDSTEALFSIFMDSYHKSENNDIAVERKKYEHMDAFTAQSFHFLNEVLKKYDK